MTYEYSDDEGESWSVVTLARSILPPLPEDHQSIASAPHSDAIGYPNVMVYCINTGVQGAFLGGAYCGSSFDGGLSWSGHVPGFPAGQGQCSGLHGHLVGANDGSIYRGQPSCDGPAIYRSGDGGRTWTEHTITTDRPMRGHELAAAVDDGNNVHAFWIGDDDLPYYSNSQDQGATWSDPMMVAPPGINATGFPTIIGGADGRAAFAYIGTNGSGQWQGFIGAVTDAFAAQPLITTVQVNLPGDPLDDNPDCGMVRCGGFGDFIDIVIDAEGRPWAAMSHNPSGEIGIVGTFALGPALRGNLTDLPPLPLGGPSTLP